MNKKTYLITGLVGLFILLGAGCTTEQTTNTSLATETGADTSVSETNQYKYKNSAYGFSLVFPESWGTIKERQENGGKINASIQLSAEDDSARFIKIQVVKSEDKTDPAVIDYPQTYLTENSTYSYYYSGSGDYAGYPDMEEQKYFDIQKEVKEISKTFSLTDESTEPLSYSTTGVNASVSKTTAPFDYTAEQLKANADECGTEQEAGIALLYFDELVAKFSGTTKIIYSFQYLDAIQKADTFVVTLLPNKAGYTSADQFKRDFDICAAGEGNYPKMLNKDWLLFESSCGSGRADGSKQPIGCDEVKKVVEPSLKLNTGLITYDSDNFIIEYPGKYSLNDAMDNVELEGVDTLEAVMLSIESSDPKAATSTTGISITEYKDAEDKSDLVAWAKTYAEKIYFPADGVEGTDINNYDDYEILDINGYNAVKYNYSRGDNTQGHEAYIIQGASAGSRYWFSASYNPVTSEETRKDLTALVNSFADKFRNQ